MNIGLLIIRAVVGLLLAGHGAQKLFGWYGGHGLEGTGGFFETIGFRPGKFMAFLGGFGELAGGLCLAFGFLTPLGAAAVTAVMLNAIMAVHRGKGPWATNGGWELAFINAAVAVGVAFAGPGQFSVDRLFDWALYGNVWGVTAIVLAVVSASATLAARAVSETSVKPDGTEATRAA